MKTKTLNNEAETLDFAKYYAKSLKPGDIVALYGNLGAGKTVFAKGLAFILDKKIKVRSPSFLIMKVYELNNKKIKRLCHIDAYRLKTASELEAVGASDFLGAKDTVCVIEWPKNVQNILKKYKNVKKIKIEIMEEDKRRITY